jgi:hypothetical protein
MTNTNDLIVDIEEHAKGKKPVPEDCSEFKVRIDDQKFRIADPVVTGRQLLQEAGKRPVVEHLVFQRLKKGQMEEIRLDETVDLRQPGLERFITFRSDRSFRILIDDERYEWGAPEITGLMLKKLAGVDPGTYDVWLEVRESGEDIRIENNETVSLEDDGVERFFTGKSTTTEG